MEHANINELLEQTVDPKWFIPEAELDDMQYIVYNLKVDENFIIRGCAGSGKSVLALHRALQFVLNDKTCAFVVFTKALKIFIEDGLKALNVPGYDKIKLYYYHEINFEFLLKELGKVDFIIVDEIQDFEIEKIEKLIKLSSNYMLFGDDAQQLYSENNDNIKIDDIISYLKIADENILALEINHRNTLEIVKYASYIIDDNDNLINSIMKNPKHSIGVAPTSKKFLSIEDELEYIYNFIINEKPLNVAILAFSNKDLGIIKDFFDQKGMKVDYKINYKNPLNYSDNISLDFNKNYPKLLTYHSSKGLQFDHVFLPNCCVSSDKYNSRNALFVACTRAMESLHISYNTKKSMYIKD